MGGGFPGADMAPRPGDPPVLLVRWYDLTRWLLERVESFPDSEMQVATAVEPVRATRAIVDRLASA